MEGSANRQERSPFFTVREFYEANERKIGINTLREWVKRGRIKSVRVGKKFLVPKTELTRLVELGDRQ
jgi:excisionase family DNA binding protein